MNGQGPLHKDPHPLIQGICDASTWRHWALCVYLRSYCMHAQDVHGAASFPCQVASASCSSLGHQECGKATDSIVMRRDLQCGQEMCSYAFNWCSLNTGSGQITCWIKLEHLLLLLLIIVTVLLVTCPNNMGKKKSKLVPREAGRRLPDRRKAIYWGAKVKCC